jgi:HD-GYP domain-containing protein (c-di-GMP phosphodiesterase class II)
MQQHSATEEQLVEASRERRPRGLSGRERVVRWIEAVTLLGAALPLAVFGHSQRPLSVAALVVIVGLFALASRTEFEIATGVAVPTELVLVPALFILPVTLVPLAVAAGHVLGHLPQMLKRKLAVERGVVLVAYARHAVAPALVLLAAGEPSASSASAGVLLLALSAQLISDFGLVILFEPLAQDIKVRDMLIPLRWVAVVDIMFAPIGLLVAIACQDSLLRLCAVTPLLGLIAMFAREREARIGNALDLSHAYRGTALLLGDVVEADHEYTGTHSRHVTDLVLDVADELGLPHNERHKAELTAMLHDVGKIRIPQSIIDKPGKLNDEEWKIMQTHTIEGQRLLNRVGGLLSEVGDLVRACHERYDGKGYPDGVAGEEIPLVARIVCCCDAYDAMVSDRSYRKALPVQVALEELARNRGTQFDPRVVDALTRVIERDLPDEDEPPALLAAA